MFCLRKGNEVHVMENWRKVGSYNGRKNFTELLYSCVFVFSNNWEDRALTIIKRMVESELTMGDSIWLSEK